MARKLNFCSFEMIYFMHHDSIVNGTECDEIRYNLGYKLGTTEKKIIKNSIVVCLPNSAIPNARGFSDAIGRPYFPFIKKRKNMIRTFILPSEKKRQDACDKKFMFDSENLANKDIYLIDDSIVRGTTMKSVITKLRDMGVNTINVRITSPVIISPCYFGIDMSTKEELISNNKSVEEIKNELNVDSLIYIDINSMKEVFGINVCTSCFTGEYNKELLDW